MKAQRSSLFFFLLPGVGVLLVFAFLPILASLILAFTNYDIHSLASPEKTLWIGWENFEELFEDELFYKAMGNTFLTFFMALPLTLMLSLFLGNLLNRKNLVGKSFFQTAFYLPYITNTIAIAVVWKWIYSADFGLLNYVLLVLGLPHQFDWLGDPSLALISVTGLVVWKGVGYNVLIVYTGLQQIPESLYEAAEIDGVSVVQRFFYITLPLLRPTVIFISTMMVIGYLQLFAEPFILTQGGPVDSTVSIVMYLYENGFRSFRLGYASSVALILFLLIMLFTALNFKLTKEKGASS